MLQFHPTRALRVNAFHHAFQAAPAGASTAANTAGGGKRGEAGPRTPKATAASLAVLPSTPASFLSTKKKTRKSLDFGPETRHGGGGGGDGDGGGAPLPARKRQKSMKPMKELAAQQAKPSATPSRKHRKLPSTRTQPGTPNEKKKKKNRAQFVVKLFDMLNAKRHADIVSWHAGGFVIWDRARFASTVLPVLFNHQNFSSFERQMNFYSFSKMSVGDEFSSKKRMKKTEPTKWKHRLFFKGTSQRNIASIKRSTDPNKVQEIKKSLEIVESRNAQLLNKMKSLAQITQELEAELAALPPLPAESALGPDIFDDIHAGEAGEETPDLLTEGFPHIEDAIVEYLLEVGNV